jgi:hypothetical protein
MKRRKFEAILVTLFLLALAFSLSIAPVSASSGLPKTAEPELISPNVSYSYSVINDHGSGSGTYPCGSQTWSSSSSVSSPTLKVSWSGPGSSACPWDLGSFGSLVLYIHDSAGTVVYNGLEYTPSGSQNFNFLDNQVIVYVSVTWNYYCCSPSSS